MNTVNDSVKRTCAAVSLLCCALAFLVLCACTHPVSRPPAPGLERFDMNQAQMISMKPAAELRLEIGGPYGWDQEILARACNPVSGECFTGRMMLMEKGESSTAVVTNAWGFKTGEIQTSSGGKTKTARGILKGDKGTIIHLTLETQRVDENRPGGGAPFYYRGFGEGTDNHDSRYSVQFSGNSLRYWYKDGDDLLKSARRDLQPGK